MWFARDCTGVLDRNGLCFAICLGGQMTFRLGSFFYTEKSSAIAVSWWFDQHFLLKRSILLMEKVLHGSSPKFEDKVRRCSFACLPFFLYQSIAVFYSYLTPDKAHEHPNLRPVC